MKKQKRADANTLGAKTMVVLSSLSLTAGGWAYFAHTEGQAQKAVAQEPAIVITATPAQVQPASVSNPAPRVNAAITLPERKPMPTLAPIVRVTLPPLVKKIIPAPPLREVAANTSEAPQAQAAAAQPVAPVIEPQALAAQPPAAQPQPPAAQPQPQPPPASQPQPEPPAAQPQPPAPQPQPPPVVQPAPPPAPAPPADTGSSKKK